jgi:hypothetical protein
MIPRIEKLQVETLKLEVCTQPIPKDKERVKVVVQIGENLNTDIRHSCGT